MKRIIILFSSAFLIFGVVGEVNAALVDQLNGTILDTNTGKYWYADLEYFSDMTYAQQLDAIDGIGSGFHLASLSEMQALFNHDVNSLSEIGAAFKISGPIVKRKGDYDLYRWRGRYEHSRDSDPYHEIAVIDYDDGLGWRGGYEYLLKPGYEVTDDYMADHIGAWVTSNTALVPVPATLLLLGSGLIGIVGVRRKFKK